MSNVVLGTQEILGWGSGEVRSSGSGARWLIAIRFLQKCSYGHALVICCCVTSHPKLSTIKQLFYCVHRLCRSGIWRAYSRDVVCFMMFGASAGKPIVGWNHLKVSLLTCPVPSLKWRKGQPPPGLSTGTHTCVLSMLFLSLTAWQLAQRENTSGGFSTKHGFRESQESCVAYTAQTSSTSSNLLLATSEQVWPA